MHMRTSLRLALPFLGLFGSCTALYEASGPASGSADAEPADPRSADAAADTGPAEEAGARPKVVPPRPAAMDASMPRAEPEATPDANTGLRDEEEGVAADHGVRDGVGLGEPAQGKDPAAPEPDQAEQRNQGEDPDRPLHAPASVWVRASSTAGRSTSQSAPEVRVTVTKSPTAKPGFFDSSTCATADARITSPIATGLT